MIQRKFRLPAVDQEHLRGAPRCSRRDFAGALGIGAVGVAAMGCSTSNEDARVVALADTSELDVGSIKDVTYPLASDAAFITRLGRPAEGGVGEGKDIVAFLKACPHMGCPISQVDPKTAIVGPCYCHRSRFDIAAGGVQIVGRAVENLAQIVLALDGTTVYATGLVGVVYGRPLEAT